MMLCTSVGERDSSAGVDNDDAFGDELEDLSFQRPHIPVAYRSFIVRETGELTACSACALVTLGVCGGNVDCAVIERRGAAHIGEALARDGVRISAGSRIVVPVD